ncbi:hypothetical protein NFI96_010310 [Prochilodus magdalenae]|nr:hypothetical protein NFI96_010310 [Prochilodus magdalenae]
MIQLQQKKNVKKPKKAEVNYLPPYPTGETKESLERDVDRAERASDFSQHTMNIFIVKKEGASEDDDYEDIGIVLEGQE